MKDIKYMINIRCMLREKVHIILFYFIYLLTYIYIYK